MKASDEFPDVVLVIDERKFPCCRKVLADHSPYFQAMFSHNFAEKDKHTIEIKEVDPMAMDILLQSIQRGPEVLDLKSSDDLLSILQAASMLQFTTLQSDCVDEIARKWLTPDTCLPIMCKAHALSLTELHYKARCLALWEFTKVKKTSSFLELPIYELEEYLQDEGLNIVNGEFEVFEAALSWLQNTSNSDKDRLYLSVLQCIRFSDISISDIRTMFLYLNATDHHVVLQLLECVLDIKSGRIESEDATLQTQESFQNTVEPTEQFPNDKKNIVIGENCCCIPPTDDSSTTSEYGVQLLEMSENKSVLMDARLLLNTPPRMLPIVPCVVGHCFTPPKPYLICFKENKPFPFLPLTKAQQGPTEPNGYSVVKKGQNLFVLGGEFFWGHSNWNKSVWRYNLWDKTWTFETSLDHPCRHQSVCFLGDDMFVIGGFGKHRIITDSVRKYNTISKIWTRCAPLPHPVYAVACCIFKESIYVFGQQVWSYRPERNSWITLATHSHISFNSAMPIGDTIYLTGMYSNDLMKFESNCPDGPFTTVGSFTMSCTNSCLVHDKIFLFGTDFDANMSVEVYSIKENTFSVLWTGTKTETNLIQFSPTSPVGCFPIVKY